MQKARLLFRRMSSRSWTGNDDPLEERYTAAEMLSLCAAMVTAISLLSLPIIFHYVQEKVYPTQSLLVNILLYIYILYACKLMQGSSDSNTTSAGFVEIDDEATEGRHALSRSIYELSNYASQRSCIHACHAI